MAASSPDMTRDRPINKGRAALLIIDVQNGTCGPKEADSRPEFYKATALRVIPNIALIIASFRAAKLEIIYTVIENLTADGVTAVSTTSFPTWVIPKARTRLM